VASTKVTSKKNDNVFLRKRVFVSNQGEKGGEMHQERKVHEKKVEEN